MALSIAFTGYEKAPLCYFVHCGALMLMRN